MIGVIYFQACEVSGGFPCLEDARSRADKASRAVHSMPSPHQIYFYIICDVEDEYVYYLPYRRGTCSY